VGDKIACTRCQDVLERRNALAEVAPASQAFHSDEDVAAEMTQEARIRANVAAMLGVPADTVDVALLPTRRITIFLSPAEVTRLSGT
jgi:TctA family transporter